MTSKHVSVLLCARVILTSSINTEFSMYPQNITQNVSELKTFLAMHVT